MVDILLDGAGLTELAGKGRSSTIDSAAPPAPGLHSEAKTMPMLS